MDDNVSALPGFHNRFSILLREQVATIVCLSLFLFYSVILTETRQVMHQMTLNCGLRCYEAALLGNQAFGRHHPLVASVNMVKAEGRFGLLRLYLLFVGTRCPLPGHVSSAPPDPSHVCPRTQATSA